MYDEQINSEFLMIINNLLYAAAVAYGPGQPLIVEEILVHPPKPMEVRIKILFTSICHSDLSAWKGEVQASLRFNLSCHFFFI